MVFIIFLTSDAVSVRVCQQVWRLADKQAGLFHVGLFIMALVK